MEPNGAGAEESPMVTATEEASTPGEGQEALSTVREERPEDKGEPEEETSIETPMNRDMLTDSSDHTTGPVSQYSNPYEREYSKYFIGDNNAVKARHLQCMDPSNLCEGLEHRRQEIQTCRLNKERLYHYVSCMLNETGVREAHTVVLITDLGQQFDMMA